MVFVSLLLEALEPEAYAAGRRGCTVLPPLPRSIAVGPPEHRQAIAAGVLSTLQLDLKDARADREPADQAVLSAAANRSLTGRSIPKPRGGNRLFARRVLAALPFDPVGDVVAGVIGSVFRLAGHNATVVAVGCRIGHTLGRLMNFSDGLEDYFDDLKAGRPNPSTHERGDRARRPFDRG